MTPEASRQATSYQVGYVVGTSYMLIISSVMLRSQILAGTATAYVGIAARVIGFGVYVPKVELSFPIFSILGMQVGTC